MRRLLAFLTLFCVIPSLALVALDVDREELEGQITRTVEFQNYRGPFERVETIETIRGIGAALAQGPRGPGEVVDYYGRYQIIHAVDPHVSQGLDADILVVLEDARVDHIDNIRRILSAYLEDSYGYTRFEGWLIAEFVTIYNAIYRGDMPFFAQRYKSIVVDNLSERNVGMSTHYGDWPGRTRLVTPLLRRGGEEVSASVDYLALMDDRVVDELRTQPHMALEQRRDMVELIERQIYRDEISVERQETVIASEREQIEHERRRIDLERQRVAEDVEHQRMDTAEAKRRETELRMEEQELERREEALTLREDDLARDREQIARRIDETRQRREQIAEDTRTVMERASLVMERAAREVLFMQTRMRAGRPPERRLVVPVGQLMIIDGETAALLQASQIDAVTSRAIERWTYDWLVIAEDNGTARLTRIDAVTLDAVMVGSAQVFPGSMIVPRPDRGEIFAVVRDGGGWHLGRFNGSLALLERSLMQVDPSTHITVTQDVIYVQRADGVVKGLALGDLVQE